MSSEKWIFTAECSLDSVAQGAAELQRYAGEIDLSSRKMFQLDLIYEELLTNVVKYSYPDPAGHTITVTLEKQGEDCIFEVIHDGMDFNPWNVESPDLDLPLEERSEGGLGIHLVKQFSKSLDYSRENGMSIVKVVF
ncbi:MAG: ATP-binding protein [Lentisphaeria bacterium]|nr:ATP-binding protein [Lentisphaeria bacterium]